MCDLFDVECIVIVHTLVDCEEIKDKEGADTCIKQYNGSTSGGIGCEEDEEGDFENVRMIVL